MGEDLRLYFQTVADGEVSFLVAGQSTAAFPNGSRLTIPVELQTLLNNLASGDRWIFKAARVVAAVPEELAASARARDPTASFDLAAVAPSTAEELAMSARAGAPTASFDLEAIAPSTPKELAVSARAGAPTASFDLEAIVSVPLELAISARAGLPTIAFNLDHPPAGPDAPTNIQVS